MIIDTIQEYAYAKINLGLAIVGLMDHGYHDIKTVMHTVDLYDEIKIVFTDDDDIKIIADDPSLPTNRDNTAYRAADIMRDIYDIKKGIEIYIKKNIPSQAGLGGGSSDAAAVIRGIKRFAKIDMFKEDMIKVASLIGADVPFALFGGCALCKGKGDKLIPISASLKNPVIIIKPSCGMSTEELYHAYDDEHGEIDDEEIKKDSLSIDKVVYAIMNNDLQSIAKNIHNVFTPIATKRDPIIGDLIDCLKKQGAIVADMTGTGSCIYGIYDDEDKAKNSESYLRDNIKDIKIYRTYLGGR